MGTTWSDLRLCEQKLGGTGERILCTQMGDFCRVPAECPDTEVQRHGVKCSVAGVRAGVAEWVIGNGPGLARDGDDKSDERATGRDGAVGRYSWTVDISIESIIPYDFSILRPWQPKSL